MDAYKYIKGAIIDGRYTPGMRLGEEFLAKELNLSRTPIREAIRHLEAEGLVVPLKRGVSVRNFTRSDRKKTEWSQIQTPCLGNGRYPGNGSWNNRPTQ